MPFHQFQSSEGGKASKAVVIGAAVIACGHGANVHKHIKDKHRKHMRGACCAHVKGTYRKHSPDYHPDQRGCKEVFVEWTNEKEKALKTCKPCSHDGPKTRGRKPDTNKPDTKYRKRPTSSKKKAKRDRRKAKQKQKQREKEKQREKQKQREKDNDHETKVSATSAAIVVGGLVLASGGPDKKKKKRVLRQPSNRNINQ